MRHETSHNITSNNSRTNPNTIDHTSNTLYVSSSVNIKYATKTPQRLSMHSRDSLDFFLFWNVKWVLCLRGTEVSTQTNARAAPLSALVLIHPPLLCHVSFSFSSPCHMRLESTHSRALVNCALKGTDSLSRTRRRTAVSLNLSARVNPELHYSWWCYESISLISERDCRCSEISGD